MTIVPCNFGIQKLTDCKYKEIILDKNPGETF